MATRLEFSKATKAKAMLRCGGRCEGCGDKLFKPEFDHVTPAALGGDASLENCRVLCCDCHYFKTHSKGGDRTKIGKANRLRDGKRGSRVIMPGSKRSRWKRKLNGKVERRPK